MTFDKKKAGDDEVPGLNIHAIIGDVLLGLVVHAELIVEIAVIAVAVIVVVISPLANL
jgi:hypothetical protein